MRIGTGAGWVSLLLICTGCTPPGGPADNTVELVLGNTGVFTDGVLAGTQQGRFFDISDELPAEDPESATMVIDPDDITVDVGTSGPAGDPSTNITVLILLADRSADDPCDTTPSFSLFTIEVDSGGAVTVTPESATLPVDNLALVATGSFGLCVVVSGDRDVDLTIRAIRITFTPPGPVAARSCPEVLALPEVQEALAVLGSNGVRFRVPTGDVSVDLEGAYVLDQQTTFDPDDADVGDTQDGNITMLSQRPGVIARQGFGGRVDFFSKAMPARSGSARWIAPSTPRVTRPWPGLRT